MVGDIRSEAKLEKRRFKDGCVNMVGTNCCAGLFVWLGSPYPLPLLDKGRPLSQLPERLIAGTLPVGY